MKTRNEESHQLSLLPSHEIAEIKEDKSPASVKKRRKIRIKNEANWWKLSEREKLVGIAGIQSVRDVLAKSRDLPGETWAKAS